MGPPRQAALERWSNDPSTALATAIPMTTTTRARRVWPTSRPPPSTLRSVATGSSTQQPRLPLHERSPLLVRVQGRREAQLQRRPRCLGLHQWALGRGHWGRPLANHRDGGVGNRRSRHGVHGDQQRQRQNPGTCTPNPDIDLEMTPGGLYEAVVFKAERHTSD
jgi:hypothetical protein